MISLNNPKETAEAEDAAVNAHGITPDLNICYPYEHRYVSYNSIIIVIFLYINIIITTTTIVIIVIIIIIIIIILLLRYGTKHWIQRNVSWKRIDRGIGIQVPVSKNYCLAVANDRECEWLILPPRWPCG